MQVFSATNEARSWVSEMIKRNRTGRDRVGRKEVIKCWQNKSIEAILMGSRDLFAKLSNIIGQSKVGQLAWTVEPGQWASSEFGSQP